MDEAIITVDEGTQTPDLTTEVDGTDAVDPTAADGTAAADAAADGAAAAGDAAADGAAAAADATTDGAAAAGDAAADGAAAAGDAAANGSMDTSSLESFSSEISPETVNNFFGHAVDLTAAILDLVGKLA